MGEGLVRLNSVDYVIESFDVSGREVLVHRESVEQLGQLQRQIGRQQQDQISTYSSQIFPNFALGFGRDRIDSDSADKVNEYRRFFDSTSDTRWNFATYLGILDEDSTEANLDTVVRVSALFKGNLWSFWEHFVSPDYLIAARSYTGSTTTWGGGATWGVVDTNPKLVLDVIAHKTHMIVLWAYTNDHLIQRSTNGTTWAAATTPPTVNLFTNNVTANEDIDGGLLAQSGNHVIATVWHESNGTITFFSSADAGDVWGDEAVDIASGNGPQGVAIYPDIDGVDKLYVGTREGLYLVDTTVSTWTFQLVFPMPAHNDNCRRMTVHNGALWFAQGTDDDSPAPMYRMTVEGDRRIFEIGIGLSAGDGVPSDLLGPVRWMHSVQDQLFYSVGGGKASRKARIMAVREDDRGRISHHSMFAHGTANQKIVWVTLSADDDGTPRLHYAARTASNVTNSRFLGQPLVNPQSGVSIKRQASSYIDLPYIDGGGMPSLLAAWLRVGIHAFDLSASNSGEFINVDTDIVADLGTLTARGSFSDLGDYLSGTRTQDINSGAGTSGLSLALRVNLLRDSSVNTHTPKLKDVEVDYYKFVPRVVRFRFMVNLNKTAERDDRQPEAVITQLETVEALSTLPTFQYANMTATNVRVKPLVWLEEPYSEGDAFVEVVPDTLSQRGGFCLVEVEEVIG
jgi:hypothetical protein